MENRPVFESFDEFIKFVYEAALNEGLAIKNFDELQRSLGTYGLSSEGKTALAAIEEVTIKGNWRALSNESAEAVLQNMAQCIKNMTLKDKTKISSIDFYRFLLFSRLLVVLKKISSMFGNISSNTSCIKIVRIFQFGSLS